MVLLIVKFLYMYSTAKVRIKVLIFIGKV